MSHAIACAPTIQGEGEELGADHAAKHAPEAAALEQQKEIARLQAVELSLREEIKRLQANVLLLKLQVRRYYKTTKINRILCLSYHTLRRDRHA